MFLKKLLLLLPFLLLLGCHSKKNNDTLFVGTTGDYSPLTYYNTQTKEFEGDDINLAKDLAKELGYKNIRFIKTSWPSLTEDLASKKFDIAIGGICSNSERRAASEVSIPVRIAGKSPLIRKNDKKKYHTLKDIDKEGVRVVENYGGTNFDFAKDNIKNASLIIVQENKTNFEYLKNHKADVMFTDNIEAVHRAKIDSDLYAVNPSKPFNKVPQVILIQKNNKELKNKINKYLKSNQQGI